MRGQEKWRRTATSEGGSWRLRRQKLSSKVAQILLVGKTLSGALRKLMHLKSTPRIDKTGPRAVSSGDSFQTGHTLRKP